MMSFCPSLSDMTSSARYCTKKRTRPPSEHASEKEGHGEFKADASETMGKRKRNRGPQRERDVTKPVESDRGDEESWSKSKKKRMRLLRAKQRKKGDDEEQSVVVANTRAPTQVQNRKGASSSSLQQSFRERLSGSRFRILNEELYTTPSPSSFQRFSSNPQLYEQYHEGFRKQVQQWPINPVNIIVKSLRKLSGRNPSRRYLVADFGAGDADLARQLHAIRKDGKCPFEVHSFDLVSSSPLVTACDMANVPLEKATADVGIFCLSLMGTNLADFVREAHRVLKPNGILKIAEVRSRFENKKGQDELEEFLKVLHRLGFECVSSDRSNKMFVLLELRKNNKRPRKDVSFTAKPCIYKRR